MAKFCLCVFWVIPYEGEIHMQNPQKIMRQPCKNWFRWLVIVRLFFAPEPKESVCLQPRFNGEKLNLLTSRHPCFRVWTRSCPKFSVYVVLTFYSRNNLPEARRVTRLPTRSRHPGALVRALSPCPVFSLVARFAVTPR